METFRVQCYECYQPSDPFLGPGDSASHTPGCSKIGNDSRHLLWLSNTQEDNERRRKQSNPRINSMERTEYSDDTVTILDLVASERGRQNFLKSQGKFAYTCADKEMSHSEALAVLTEEVGEAAHEVNEGIGGRYVDKRRLLKELIQVAAVAVAWAEKTHNEIEAEANPRISSEP